MVGGSGVHLFKGAKDVFLLFLGDADAGIFDRKIQERFFIGVLIGNHINDDLAFVCEFYCIFYQIEQDLTQAARIPHQAVGRVGSHTIEQLKPFCLRAHAHHAESIFHKNTQIERSMFQLKFVSFNF